MKLIEIEHCRTFCMGIYKSGLTGDYKGGVKLMYPVRPVFFKNGLLFELETALDKKGRGQQQKQ
jgi:hypothetical protein